MQKLSVADAKAVVDVNLVERWKQGKALVPILLNSIKRSPGSIVVLCNSGRQFVERVLFYQLYIADAIHPVPDHGGAIRLSHKHFDPNLKKGILKAKAITGYTNHICEGHFPCAEALKEDLDLRGTMTHTLYGFQKYMDMFGTNGDTVLPIFHFDYSGVIDPPKRPMESFLINVDRMFEMVYC